MVPSLLGWSSTSGNSKRRAAVSVCEFPGKSQMYGQSRCGAADFKDEPVVVGQSGARSQRMETSSSIESCGKLPSTTAVTTS
jgi:hypothetical protein